MVVFPARTGFLHLADFNYTKLLTSSQHFVVTSQAERSTVRASNFEKYVLALSTDFCVSRRESRGHRSPLYLRRDASARLHNCFHVRVPHAREIFPFYRRTSPPAARIFYPGPRAIWNPHGEGCIDRRRSPRLRVVKLQRALTLTAVDVIIRREDA